MSLKDIADLGSINNTLQKKHKMPVAGIEFDQKRNIRFVICCAQYLGYTEKPKIIQHLI